MDETGHICPWCSTSIPAGAAACPRCGAVVEGAVAPDIPGVTVVDSKAAPGHGEGRVPDAFDPKSWLQAGRDDQMASPDAVLPPSEAVRLEMRKMELEAEIENAGRSVMSPTRDEARNVGKPSREALEAFEAGQLDTTGPAGETDLAERAKTWEDEEKR
ncbi:MAG: hypothetical protein ABSA21_01320 [Candidatus Limnocylindrales bacterium]|jgi:hypothetical protein